MTVIQTNTIVRWALLILLLTPWCGTAAEYYGGSGAGLGGGTLLAGCHDCGLQECGCGPTYSVAADLIWLSRSRARQQSIIFAPGGLGFSQALNARDLLFDVEAGVRGEIAFDLPNGRGLELGYFGIFDQAATADLSDPNMFFTLYNVFPLVLTNGYTVNYESELHSGELNWRLCECLAFRPLVGVRWIRHSEDFDVLDTSNAGLHMLSDVSNNLVGAQLGFDVCLWDRGGWFRVEATMKSGLYHNAMNLHADVRDAAGVVFRLDRDFDATAFSGEIGVTAVWQVTPHLALRFGYHGLWLARVALAPDQANDFDIVTGAGNVDLGPLNYQGGTMGLEVTW